MSQKNRKAKKKGLKKKQIDKLENTSLLALGMLDDSGSCSCGAASCNCQTQVGASCGCTQGDTCGGACTTNCDAM